MFIWQVVCFTDFTDSFFFDALLIDGFGVFKCKFNYLLFYPFIMETLLV